MKVPMRRYCALVVMSITNYDTVRGEGFFGQTRRERRAYPSGVCEERATKSGRKRTAARKGCVEFGLGLRCSSVTDPLRDMLPPRALPQAKFGATNVIVFMLMTTKDPVADPSACRRGRFPIAARGRMSSEQAAAPVRRLRPGIGREFDC